MCFLLKRLSFSDIEGVKITIRIRLQLQDLWKEGKL